MMDMNLKKFCISLSADIMDALKQINSNTKGFVIIIDRFEVVCGILTDGDIRRAFVKGYNISTPVKNISRREFKFLSDSATLADAVELFKDGSIQFIPILDDGHRLSNILTKRQMHTLLLLDIHTDLSYDFSSLDENAIDYEIFQRPWGFYKTTVMNDYFQSKVISVNPGGQLSLQSHNHREEHWIIAHGIGKVQLDQTVMDVRCGNSIFIPRGCKHRLINTDEKESLIITEVQIGDYFGEDDIIRYEDKYGRK